MYSYEDRMKAVMLYIKYDFSAADTVRELGYPTRQMLVRWYREYEATGELHRQYKREPRHTPERMQAAVDYYLSHGRCISRTVKAMGYPSRATLRKWIDQLAPGERKVRVKRSSGAHLSNEQKNNAVVELCTREGSASYLPDQLGTSREYLYMLKKKLLGERDTVAVKESSRGATPKDRDAMMAELESQNKQIYQKQLDLDILNKNAYSLKEGTATGTDGSMRLSKTREQPFRRRSSDGSCERSNSLSYTARRNADTARTRGRLLLLWITWLPATSMLIDQTRSG